MGIIARCAGSVVAGNQMAIAAAAAAANTTGCGLIIIGGIVHIA